MIRALAAYYGANAKSTHQDMKVSFATSEDMTHSKTWHLGDLGEAKAEADEVSEDVTQLNRRTHEIALKHPVPEKLLFLATGEGCATVQVLSDFRGI